MKNSFEEELEFSENSFPKKEKKKTKSGCAWCGDFHGGTTTVRCDDGRPERVCFSCAQDAGL